MTGSLRLRLRACLPLEVLPILISLVAIPGWGSASEPSPRPWAYAHPQRPAIPEIHHPQWVRNPIDALVLARLEAADLEPNPTADRAALLRRVTYDLTGLAPTMAEYDAFLNDPAPDAYERLVDRLLNSPRFGERWAQHWLDVVRYADTEGFKLDRERPEAYRYRDYVIRAFNDDLPYDRFVRQQLAGDELEPDNPDALIATGFYRIHPEETNAGDYCQVRQDLFDDITDVFGSAFLGQTLAARNHCRQRDHHRPECRRLRLVARARGFTAQAGPLDRGQSRAGS